MLDNQQRHAVILDVLKRKFTEINLGLARTPAEIADLICVELETEAAEIEKARKELSRQLFGHTGAHISPAQIAAYREGTRL